ncbi:MAG: type II toxin-antitoxin system VapC family toxin [Microbacterium sp.]
MTRTVYFDSSALVPLLIDERSTLHCDELWFGADTIISSALAYVEVRAAIAQARRQGRIDAAQHRTAIETFELRWSDVVSIEPRESLLRDAALLAESQALRGYDAVHCATAVAAASDDLIAASGDRDLLRAWSALGLHTVDTSA